MGTEGLEGLCAASEAVGTWEAGRGCPDEQDRVWGSSTKEGSEMRNWNLRWGGRAVENERTHRCWTDKGTFVPLALLHFESYSQDRKPLG